jgi:hypothetical protein
MAEETPIAPAESPAPTVKKPAPKSAPRDEVKPVYPTAQFVEAGVKTCPTCGADLRSMSKFPGLLRCPYGHHEEPV